MLDILIKDILPIFVIMFLGFASGKSKADAVFAMLKGGISTKCPASLLSLHSDVTLICDEDAYSLCK